MVRLKITLFIPGADTEYQDIKEGWTDLEKAAKALAEILARMRANGIQVQGAVLRDGY